MENKNTSDINEVYIHHDQNLDEQRKQELINELNSLKHIDKQAQLINYYMERLYYMYENCDPNDRQYCHELICDYQKITESGTNKERRHFEKRIEHFINKSINFKINSDSRHFIN